MPRKVVTEHPAKQYDHIHVMAHSRQKKDGTGPLKRGGFFCFRDTPSGSLGRGIRDGGGVFAESLGKSYPWVVGFFFGNAELSMELWTIIAGISGVYDKR